ncbi:hypothetical protein ACIQ7N_17990 [Lysinibacillus sp. NPDC095746]|uniref:hypothetical protein n=1 Tax=Lysinibacillus sp. NPDC095746 TaxID=3364134 RepID=UPI00380E0B0D
MKRIVFVVLLLFVPVDAVELVSASSLQFTKDTFEVDEQQELSIKQAIELANPPALKWNKNAQLIDAINIDLDKRRKSIGSNGKRKHWNILFGVPETNKVFLVTIHDGKIDYTNDVTRDGTSPYPKKEFIQMKDIQYDSPELLQKALKIGGIYPGENWAKGYNFMLRKDIERNVTILLIIGWNSDQTKMKEMGFNASTGEYIKPN